MKKITKTNAMRILDKEHVKYFVHTYEHQEKDSVDGLHVATMLQENPKAVFKTLITQATSRAFYVFVIPVTHELDLKKCAKVVTEKSIAMIHVKDIQMISGYIRGGCSPFGMKKQFKTIFDEHVNEQSTIYISGGKIGCQIELDPTIAISLLQAQVYDIVVS